MTIKCYSLTLDEKVVEYSVSRSRKRRKTMAILLHPKRGMVVMVPYKTTDGQLSAFVDGKKQWITKKWAAVEAAKFLPTEFAGMRLAEEDLSGIAAEMVAKTGLKPGRILIKKLNASWGLCRGDTITLSRRLVMAPVPLIEYVVVHELCHLEHMNHSKVFWTAVGAIMPDYKSRRKQLRELGARLPLF